MTWDLLLSAPLEIGDENPVNVAHGWLDLLNCVPRYKKTRVKVYEIIQSNVFRGVLTYVLVYLGTTYNVWLLS